MHNTERSLAPQSTQMELLSPNTRITSEFQKFQSQLSILSKFVHRDAGDADLGPRDTLIALLSTRLPIALNSLNQMSILRLRNYSSSHV